ncbi:MAG: geranylgeranylglyceryl/heptaprenylglyceryl phosphate synthase [Bacteroidota bacterium]|nr:geranylgeranylglyceryl/heptaprenylglyceryl phosphate synthase [Bacteroidota bacterium]
MQSVYKQFIQAKQNQQKLLAILLDPDKIVFDTLEQSCHKIKLSGATHIFVGGSTVEDKLTEKVVLSLKQFLNIPIVLFPGNHNQITPYADALLFLSLISGNNPEFLIGQHIKAAPILHNMNLEVIPTSYLLIDGGNTTSVARVSQTQPIAQTQPQQILNTVWAGKLLGHQLTYLEAGSGAKFPIDNQIINLVSQHLSHPLIVGGGIKSLSKIKQVHDAGADIVVIGTAFEQNPNFFDLHTAHE